MTALIQASCPNLLRLELNDTGLDDWAIQQLASLPNLELMSLSNNALEDCAMIHLACGDWSYLTHLRLDVSDVSNRGEAALMKGNWSYLYSPALSLASAYPETIKVLGNGGNVNKPARMHCFCTESRLGLVSMPRIIRATWP